jgi:molybdopterin-guanine dinucleotide biosynthesis protein B
MKAIAVIGYHHTGKTTLVTTIIRELKALGHSVVSIKDIHSQQYRADTPGKNTALHMDAGAEAVFAKGLHDSALIFPNSLSLKDMIHHLKADYLIIEGMKDAPVPKLVCAETTDQLDELIDDTCFGISGLIAGSMESYSGLPVYCLQKSTKELIQSVIDNSFAILPLSEPECCSECGKSCYNMAADIVQGRAMRSDCVLDANPQMQLMVNGSEVVIVPFVQKIIRDVVLSLVDNLKNIDPDGNVEIKITR